MIPCCFDRLSCLMENPIFSRTQRNIVIAILLDLGVPTTHAGFDYLVNAILLYAQDPTQKICKSLYPRVAKLYSDGTYAMLVERSIRFVIRFVWDNKDDATWQAYFPTTPGQKSLRPTNTVFISHLARLVEMCITQPAPPGSS